VPSQYTARIVNIPAYPYPLSTGYRAPMLLTPVYYEPIP